MKDTQYNYVHLIEQYIHTQPEKIALYLPQENHTEHIKISYKALGERIAAIQCGLKKAGFVENDRILILFPVCLDLYALVLALLASNMVPVFIDIGMSFKRIMHGIKTSQAKALISAQRFLKWRYCLPKLWRLKLYSIDSHAWDVEPFTQLIKPSKQPLNIYPCLPTQYAIITFTSGSTGQPKAANRDHQLLLAQYHSLGAMHEIPSDSRCLTCFPITVLYTLARGITTVLPNMDFSRPADINAATVIQQLQHLKINYLVVGPAFIDAICNKVIAQQAVGNIDLSSMQHVLVGGAPVSKKLAQKIVQSFPTAYSAVGYGSTEAEPIACYSMKEMIQQNVNGSLVGKPVADIEVEIVHIPSNLSIPSDCTILPALNLQQQRCQSNAVGEILLAGKQVLSHYLSAVDDQHCKLQDETGKVWHRIGDIGYLQANGQLVLVGRSNDSVSHDGKTMYPLMIETPLMNFAGIRFAAYLSVTLKGQQTPIVCLQYEKISPNKMALLDKIKALFTHYNLSLPTIYCIDKMPVDGRHNSKIDRSTLIKQVNKRIFSVVKPC